MMTGGVSLWAGVISGGMAQVQDTMAFNNGQITGKEYAAHTTKNVTGALGLMAGIEYGAIAGSMLLPGVGTIVGSIIGGIIGDRVGQVVGHQTGNLLFHNRGFQIKIEASNNTTS
jgi:outer membrane lipoprotein SlyB